MRTYLDYSYIAATIVLTVYGQFILKWRIGQLPIIAFEKIKFLTLLFLDPIILSSFLAAFIASLTWMAAMTKFNLSHAYPFMSLNFVIILLLSGWLLSEPITISESLGVGLITLGTIIAAHG